MCVKMPQRMPCNTPTGSALVLEAIRQTRFEASPEMLDFKWWSSKNCKSKMPLKCTVCGFFPENATVDKFMQRRSAACWCNNQANWSSTQGIERLNRILESSRFRLLDGTDLQELERNLCSNTKLPLVCSVCDFRPGDCMLRHFKDTRTAACWCNGQASYSSASGHEQVLQAVLTCGLKPSSELESLEWYTANIKGEHDKIPVLCPTCNSISRSTSISNFMRRKSVACDCRWKTQSMVREWLEDHVSALFPTTRVVSELKAPDRIQSQAAGGRLAYDIVLQKNNKPILIIEVDGRQHFENNSHWEQTKVNDLHKEVAAIEDGIPMIRLYQPTVWRGKFDWRSWLVPMVARAVLQTLEVIVHRHPNCMAYLSESYVCRRKHTIVEVL